MLDDFAIMSDSLPTICADQLTKAVNLAAAGTFTALDEENDDEQEHVKGKWGKEKMTKGTEPSSPLTSLKLLEALSSSMTSNLSQLSQLDNDNHSVRAGITGNVNCRNRQKNNQPVPATAPVVKKYSNRKNYKLLPPVIPSQIGAGVRKIRPVGVQQRQQVVTLSPSLKPVPQNDLIEYQVRPLTLPGSNVMLMSPPKSHVSPKLPTSLAVKTSSFSSPFIEKNDVAFKCTTTQSLVVQDTTPLKVVSTIKASSAPVAGGLNNPVSTSHMSMCPTLNLQVTSKFQPVGNSFQQLQVTAASQNQISFIATGLSKPDQSCKEGTLHTLSNSINTLHQTSGTTQANSSPVSSSSSKEDIPNAPACTKMIRDPLKDLATIASKSVYVPILPQPPVDNTAAEKAGQLVFKDSCLYMIQPNGSLQTVAFMHPQIINSSRANTNQLNNTSMSHSESVNSSTNLIKDSSTTNINYQIVKNNNSSQGTNFTPAQPKTQTFYSSLTPVPSANISGSSVRTGNISESQTAVSSAKNGQKTVLATIIAGPPRVETAKHFQSSVPSISTASPPNAALQYLAKLLRPKSTVEPVKSLTVSTQKKSVEAAVNSKQPTNNDAEYKTLNQHSYSNKSSMFYETVLSPNLPSNHEQMSKVPSSHPDNHIFHPQSMSSSYQSLNADCPMLAEQNDTESDNASATAVAAAAMMSLSQTTDHIPRCDTTVSLNPTPEDVAFNETYRHLATPKRIILNDLSSMASHSNILSELPSKSPHSSLTDFPAECSLKKTNPTDSKIPTRNEAFLQPHSTQKFDGNFLVPSTCGKKIIVSPSGIKHLQSILRQKGISEGYFVITSPRASNHSLLVSYQDSPTVTQQENIISTPFKECNETNAIEDPKTKSTTCVSPIDKELSPTVADQEENDSKSWISADMDHNGKKDTLSSKDFECEDSDDSSCTSYSSSTALVIETGEDEEQERAHQSPKNYVKTTIPDQGIKESIMINNHEENRDTPQDSKTKASEASPCPYVLDKLHDNSCIPQSPLSLSDLVRQQANRNGLLSDKDSDYMYFKSPGNARKEVFDNMRELPVSESNEFVLPAPVSHIQASNSQQSQQSPCDAIMDNDIVPDDRRNVFTPGSLLPVDLSYERDSHLVGTDRSEHEPAISQSPPKVSTSTTVPSPKSPFMVSNGVSDQAPPLNPPMTPNTMLINLLNRVPTPLLTNNQDLLTLPTSQESRNFELNSSSKLKNSLLEKRDESIYSEKVCSYTDSQEYADSLTANSLFTDSRKSIDVEQSPFETPQNALELIASNYTVPSNSTDTRSDVVNQMPNFAFQNMGRTANFERSSYTVNQNLQQEFPVSFQCNSNPQKVYQDSVQCCDHLLVTVNLDSDTPAFAVPVSHNHENYVRPGQPFQNGNNVICSQYLSQTSLTTENLQQPFNNTADDRAQASDHTGKSADSDILRHLITSTNTSYPSHQPISDHPSDSSNANFNILTHQQLSHFPSRLNNLFTNQTKPLQSSSSTTQPRSDFPRPADPQYSHTEKSASDSPCTFTDADTSFKKNAFHCAVSSTHLHEGPLLQDQEPDLEGTENLSFVIGNISKPNMPIPHGFKITGKHMTQFHSDTQESNIYFEHSHQPDSLQTLRQDSEHHFHSNDNHGVNSYEQEQRIQEFGQNTQEQSLASVYEQNHQVYAQTNQDSLQTYDQSNPQSNIQGFSQSEQQKGLQDFDSIEHGGNSLHSFSTKQHQPSIQVYEHHPDPHGISYNIESIPLQTAAPPDHGYSNSAIPPQDSSRMFAPHPDQINYMIDQQYPPAPSTYFTSSTGGGVGSTMPTLFSEQCAIGSEAPMLDGSNNHHTHPCSGSFSHPSQGLQHLPQQYPYPSKQTGTENISQRQQDHRAEEGGGSLEKQPVLPSASFSPPSVADQAASQAAAAVADVNGDDHQYSGTFPNLSIYDLYLRGSNAEARGGANETETLPGNFCVECNTMYKTQCKFHSCEYTYVTDTPILSHARLTLPSCLFLGESSVIGHTNSTGVFAKEKIAMRTKFGPLTGSPVSCDQLGSTRSFSLWQTFMGGNVKVVDSSDENSSNWLMFVKPARISLEQNLVVFQHGHSVYFVTRQEIQPQQELLYWFAKDYSRILGITDKSKSAQHMLCPHCSICKHIFPDKKELRSHQRLQHPRPCNKQCNQCSKKFSQVSHLKAHIASVHSQVKRFVCTQCGKRFSDGSNFKKHVKLHSREKAFKCQLCGRAFQQKSHLKSHMNTHMPVKSEQCGFCGERFTRAFTRRQHELQHTKQNKIQCEHCGKIFYKQKIYKNHLKIHRDERNYPCQQCHRAFRTRGNLLRHEPTCKQRKCLTLPACPPALPPQHPTSLPPPPPSPPSHLPDFATGSLCDPARSSSPLLPVLSRSDPPRSGLHNIPDPGLGSS